MDKQGIKASVTADMDSLNHTLKTSQKIAKDYEKQIASTKKELNQVGALKKWRSEINALNKKQKDGIELTKDEAQRLKDLKREATKMTFQLEKMGHATSDLNSLTRGLTSAIKHESMVFTKATKKIGDCTKSLRKMNNEKKRGISISRKASNKGGSSSGGIGSMLGKFGMSPQGMLASVTVGSAVAAVGKVTDNLRETVYDMKQYRQMGASYETAKGLEYATKGSDLTKDNIKDLFEESANVLNDMISDPDWAKAGSAKANMLSGAGMSVEDMKGMNTDEFMRYLIKKLAVVDPVRARGIIDAVLHGESNKTMAAVLDSGAKSVEELAARASELNATTQTALDGAEAYVTEVDRAQSAMGSVFTEITGRLFGTIAQSMKGAGESIIQMWDRHKAGINMLMGSIGKGISFVMGRMSFVLEIYASIFDGLGRVIGFANYAINQTLNAAKIKFNELVSWAGFDSLKFKETGESDLLNKDNEIKSPSDIWKLFSTENVSSYWDKQAAGSKKEENKGVSSASIGGNAIAISKGKSALDKNTRAVKRLTKAQEDKIKLDNERKSEMYANSAIASAYSGRALPMNNNFNMSNNVSLPDVIEKIASSGMDHIKQGLESLNISNFDSGIDLI